MRLIKGKVRFIRSIMGCFIFPLILCYFYSYIQIGSNWYEVNQWLGLALGLAFLIRGVFEYKVAKNKSNTKLSFMAAIIITLYVIARYFGIL